MPWEINMRAVRATIAFLSLLGWITFALGFIMYRNILHEVARLHLMSSVGVAVLLPMLTYGMPGLAVSILLLLHPLSSARWRPIIMAVVMFLSLPFLTGAGVTLFLAAAFIGTVKKDGTSANGIPIQWVVLVMVGCLISVTFYWISVILVPLSNRARRASNTRELVATNEYTPIQ